MEIFKKFLVSTMLLIAIGSCYSVIYALYYRKHERIIDELSIEERDRQYPDLEERLAGTQALTVLLGHRPLTGAKSILQQLSPYTLKEIAQEVQKSYSEGRPIYLELHDERGIIPNQKFSLRLMTDWSNFKEPSGRLRAIFNIPYTSPIRYEYNATDFWCIDMGTNALPAVRDILPRSQVGELKVIIHPGYHPAKK